jgi:peroxiredoxin Q/BCP
MEKIVIRAPDGTRRPAAVILAVTLNQAKGEELEMAKTPRVGEQAPDFELQGTGGTFKLSDHRGERVVLRFYPGDNTMVCTKQFCSYRDRAEDFASLDATVVGISSQDLDSHEQFTAKHGLNVPLLADVDKAVAKSYSAVMPGIGSTARAVIVIDEQGVVRDRHDHRLGLDYQTVDELKAALETVA